MPALKRNGIVVIVPAFNEAAHIGKVLQEIKRESKIVNEIVVVDDGSTDRTAEIARANGATVIRLETNEGKANAVLKGLKHARSKNAEFAVALDADIIEFPNYAIERMVTPLILSEKCSMVVAWSKELSGYKDFAHSMSHDYSGNRAFRLSALEPLFRKVKGHSKRRLFEGSGYGLEVALNHSIPEKAVFKIENSFFVQMHAFKNGEADYKRQQAQMKKVRRAIEARKRLAAFIRKKRNVLKGRVLPK